MPSDFTATSIPTHSTQLSAPTDPSVASATTGTESLTEKSLELTFCSQFSAEIAFHHFVPWPHRIVWFDLTQRQENRLGFDAATSLGGVAILFQFKASHEVTKKGRRFKIEHGQMEILRQNFGNHPGSCFYVFPDVGTASELKEIRSNVIGHTWLVDVAGLPPQIPQPLKKDGIEVRKDNCHYAYLNRPSHGTISFHSKPFFARAYQAKELVRRIPFLDKPRSTIDIIQSLKKMPRANRRFFRNMAMAVFST